MRAVNKKIFRNIYEIALLFVMLFLFISKTNAQAVTDTLREVKVHGRHKKQLSNDARINVFSPGQKIITIDSVTLQQYQYKDVGTLLSEQTPVFIHSYGFNSLATLNFRGASSSQSQVLWNGVPIQNAALGMADVSLLPVLLMDKVNVVYGSSSAMWGSGNVGGALLLEQDAPVFDTVIKKTLSVFAGAGSYRAYMAGVKASISSRRWYFLVNAFGQNARNNFPYTDALGNKTNMPNAKLSGGGGLLQSAYKIDERNIIDFSAWYQQYYREIAPALFESYSVKNHTDGSLRLLLDWNRKTINNEWYAKTSFVQDYLHYQDTSLPIVAYNTTYQYFQEIGWKQNLNAHSQLMLFTPLQISWMQINELGQIETKQQVKVALAGAYELNCLRDKLDMAINARGEVVNSTSIFLPGVNAAYMLTHWLSVRGNVQRTYRVPTLDELYYYPGGNTDLKPEQGWNEDGGYVVKLKNKDITFTHSLSVFNRVIDNWIIWYGGAIWTPHNIATVHSRGMETDNSLEWKLDKAWKLHLSVNTSYVLATTQSSYVQNDGSIGKQIPYTPRYYGHLNVGFSYRQWYLNYNHSYTGYRFITTDESEYLEPYQLGNLQLFYNTQIAHHPIQVNAQCNNIWNTQYQVANGRPMPGINWSLGIKFDVVM